MFRRFGSTVLLPSLCAAYFCSAKVQADSLTIDEIGRANRSAWSAIYSIDLTYTTSTKLIADGVVTMDRTAAGHVWQHQGGKERLLLRNLDGAEEVVDRFVDSKEGMELRYPISVDLLSSPLRPCDDRNVKCSVRRASPNMFGELVPQNLSVIQFTGAAPPMDLAELLDKWDVSITRYIEGEERIQLHATQRGSSVQDRYNGSFVDLTINARKSFMIEKVEMVEQGVAIDPNSKGYVPVKTSWQVKEWKEVEPSIWYPTSVEFCNHGNANTANSENGLFLQWDVTDIQINRSIAGKHLGFSFPENAVVTEVLDDGGIDKVYIWGQEDMPQVEFESEGEYEAYRRKICNDAPTAANFQNPVALGEAPDRSNWFLILNIAAIIGILLALWLRSRNRAKS